MHHRQGFARTALCAFALMVMALPAGATGRPTPQAEASAELVGAFSDACLRHLGDLDGVTDWAKAHGLSPLAGPSQALEAYTGDANGSAWSIRGKFTDGVVALRANTGACAIFGERADPDAFARAYDKIVASVAAQLGTTDVETPQRDVAEPSTFGRHVAKVRRVSGRGKIVSVVLLTYERPGGPYQVGMAISQMDE